LESEAVDAKYFKMVDIGRALIMEALRFTLKSNDILEWQFDFWNVEDQWCVRKKLERINGFCKEIHVIWVGEGRSDVTKRR